MKIFLESILPKMLQLSERLDKMSLLLDEPWIVLNDDEKGSKFIFRNNNEILISYNGSVNIGRWELLNRANSLLIAVDSKVKLYNHCFLDPAVLILKVDGMQDYFVLINENIVPDCDLVKYFEAKSNMASLNEDIHGMKGRQEFDEANRKLTIKYLTIENTPTAGDHVFLGNRPAPTGKYKIDTLFYIHVKDGKILRTSVL